MIEKLQELYPEKVFSQKIADFGGKNYRELWCNDKKILIWNINTADEEILLERAQDEIKKLNINENEQ